MSLHLMVIGACSDEQLCGIHDDFKEHDPKPWIQAYINAGK